MASNDSKVRQSSGAKGFLGFIRKDKTSDDLHETPRYTISAPTSQASRYSHRGHDRQLSTADEDGGFSANAGIITSIPYESTADGIVPKQVEYLPADERMSRQPLPHHLSKVASDFHQYPSFDTGKMGPPSQPASQSLRTVRASNASTVMGSPYNHSAASSATDASGHNYSRTSFDQQSIHSIGSTHRTSNMHHQNHSQSTISSHGEHTGWNSTTPVSTIRNTQYSLFSTHFNHSPAPDGFDFPQPADDRTIEQMFLDLMVKRGYQTLPEQARRQMEAYPISKKWMLVYQDRLAEWQSEQRRTGGGPKVRESIARPTFDNAQKILERANEKDSPEWYVRKVLDNSITPKELQSLSVSLRTQPIAWVRDFLEAQGQIALTNVLTKINRRQKMGPMPPTGNTQEKDLDREYDIVKCLRALMNNVYGADNALQHAQIVNALTGSLISSRISTRRLVSEVLTYLASRGEGLGHERVLAALDHLKNTHGETGRFDAWMRLVEVAIDGRGKMGSLVGASEEFRSGGVGMENLLMEYAQTSLMLVNMLINYPKHDVKLRCGIRAQFISCGIRRILSKMEGFQYEPISLQIDDFKSNEAVDYEDLMELDGASINSGAEGEVKDLTDPVQIVETISKRIQQTEAYNPFVSSLQNLLLMLQNDSGDAMRAYKLVDAMLNYVAMDRRLPDMELKQALNFTVQSLLDKLYTDSEARQASDDAVSAKQIADAALAERDEMRAQVALGADGLVSKLQKQLTEQETILDLRARQVDQLKSEVAELQRLRAQELQRNELETRELYLMLKDAQEAANSAVQAAGKNVGKDGKPLIDSVQMAGILDRQKLMERLEMQLERAKTRAKLEGKQWQKVSPSDRLRELREKMDGELDDREEDLRRFEANYHDSYFGSSRQSRGHSKIHRKAVPGSAPSAPEIPEEEEDDTVYEQARMVDVGRQPKMPSNLLKQIADTVKKDDGSDSESEGVTTGTTHPSIDVDSPKTPADERFTPTEKRPQTPSGSLPGFGSNAPPPPPLPVLNGQSGKSESQPSSLPGFSNNAPPPPPLPGFGNKIPAPPPMPNGGTVPQARGPMPPPLPGGRGRGGFLSKNAPPLPSSGPVAPLGVARPKTKLKALHWEKVDINDSTVWSQSGATLDEREERYRELSRKGVLDELERLFLAKEIRKLGGGTKKAEKKSIISSDLSKNWQIALAKFSQRSVEDIMRMILSCELEILDNNVVMDFLQRDDICNVPDNVAKLMAPYSKDWTGPKALTTAREQDPSELTREDQLYLYTAVELHHYWKPRMRALAMTRNFEPEYDEITTKLQAVLDVSNSLRDSVTLLNLLGFILLVGNFMNEPNKQATGFKISSLTRLGLVKDALNETTLLDFVERTVRDKWSEWETFAEDIAGVVTAQKINVDHLIQEAKAYINNIKNVQSSLDSGSLSDPKKFHPDDRVSVVAQRSMRDARRKAEQLSIFLEQMQNNYNEIMVFFGEDATDENARRNFFANFAVFLGEWKKAKEKNMDLEGIRRRNEASMKRKQQTANAQTASVDTVASPASTGAMDILLAKLRAAKPDRPDQRERRRRARLKEKHAVRVASGQKMPELLDLVGGSTHDPGSMAALGDPGALLTPTSETSETGSAHQRKLSEDSDADVDVADRAASLLQDMGGLNGDENNEDGDGEATSMNPSSTIRMSRRRQQSAAEEERARRRARRQQARSEISVASSGGGGKITDIAEDDERAHEAQHSPTKLATMAPASPTKIDTPITIVSPPSP